MGSYHIKSSHLITIRDKLAGFSMVRFLLECIYEQTVVYVCRDLCLTEIGQLISYVSELTGSYIVRAFIGRYF